MFPTLGVDDDISNYLSKAGLRSHPHLAEAYPPWQDILLDILLGIWLKLDSDKFIFYDFGKINIIASHWKEKNKVYYV